MKLSGLAKRILVTIHIFSAGLIVASVVYYRSTACLPFVFGVLLGSAVSSAKIVLLERTVDRALGMEKNTVVSYTRLHHMLRLLLSAAALMLAVFVPGISLWGMAAGILTFQISVYIHNFLGAK